MTVNVRRQSDSPESKRYNPDGLSHREMSMCMHTLFLTLHYLCFYQYTYNSVVCPFERFSECVSKHIKHIGGAQQTKCPWNTISGKKLSGSYPSQSSPCTICLGKPTARGDTVRDTIVSKGAEVRLLWEP